MVKMREEYDSLGMKEVPADAYYGVQSLRAAENFQITGTKVHPEFIKGLAEVKMATALTNKEAGVIDAKIADAMVTAC